MLRINKWLNVCVLILFLSSCAGPGLREDSFDQPKSQRLSIFDSRAYTEGYENKKQYSSLLSLLEKELNEIEKREQQVTSDINLREIITWVDDKEFSDETSETSEDSENNLKGMRPAKNEQQDNIGSLTDENTIKRSIISKYQLYGATNPLNNFLREYQIDSTSHTYDLEGKAYVLDCLAEVYARGLVDFKKASDYNEKALKACERINDIGLDSLPVSDFYSGQRHLYYYFYPVINKNKIDAQSFYCRKDLISVYPPEFLKEVRHGDLVSLKNRIKERKDYLNQKLGMVDIKGECRDPVNNSISDNDDIFQGDLQILKDGFAKMDNQVVYYKNFYLAMKLWDSNKTGRKIDYEHLIKLCEEGLKYEPEQRLKSDFDTKNFFNCFLGIAYLKTGKSKEGLARLEEFIIGLDEADQAEIKLSKDREAVIDEVVKSEVEKAKARAQAKESAKVFGKILLSVALVALEAYANASVASTSPGGYNSYQSNQLSDLAGRVVEGSFKTCKENLEKVEARLKVLEEINRKSLQGFVTPTTLKAARYLNKFELVELYSELGNAYKNTGDVEKAIKYYEEAVSIVEMQRTTISLESQRISFAETKDRLYKNIVPLLVRNNQPDKAFEYVERAKSRAFLDVLGGKDIVLNTTQDTEVYNSLMRQKDEIATLLDNQKIGYDQVAAAVDKRSRALEIVKSLKGKELEFKSMTDVSTISADEAKALSIDDFSIIEYFITDSALFIFLVDGGRLLVKEYAVESKELFDLIKSFRDAIASSSEAEVKESGNKLYTILFEPVINEITQKRIYIVPHSWLHYIPFQALYHDDRFIVSEYAVTYSPSATVVKISLTKRKSKNNSALLLANADLGNPELNLPYAEKEVLSISEYFQDKRVIVGKEATETLFCELADKYDILHVATHANFNVDDPINSPIYLAKDDLNDGNLTALELYRLHIDASLITLSACETGLSLISRGDEIIGLIRGAMYAGAKSIVSTLWSVEDESTSYAMDVFYNNFKTMPLDLALQDAQIKTMDKYAKSYNWAPFVLTGSYDPEKVSHVVVDPYIALLTDSGTSTTRVYAANMLGELADASAVEPLIATLNDTDWEVRQCAVNALKAIGEPAIDPLVVVFRGEDENMQKVAAVVLGEMGWMPADEAEQLKYIKTLIEDGVEQNITNALSKIGEQAIPPLVAIMKGEYGLQDKAVEALKNLGWTPADESDQIYYLIAIQDWDELLKKGDTAVTYLIQTLNDKQKTVRISAIEALAKIGDAKAVEPLIALLTDEDYEIRLNVVMALGLLGDGRAVEPLVTIMKGEGGFIQDKALEALHKLGWSPVDEADQIGYLIAVQDWDGLVKKGEPAVSYLIQALNSANKEVVIGAAKTLGEIRDIRAVEPLIDKLTKADYEIRSSAVRALGEIGDARAVKPLRELSEKDPYKQIQEDAKKALEKINKNKE